MIREYIANKFNLADASEIKEKDDLIILQRKAIQELTRSLELQRDALTDFAADNMSLRETLNNNELDSYKLHELIRKCVKAKKYVQLRDYMTEYDTIHPVIAEAELDMIDWDFEIDIEGE